MLFVDVGSLPAKHQCQARRDETSIKFARLFVRSCVRAFVHSFVLSFMRQSTCTCNMLKVDIIRVSKAKVGNTVTAMENGVVVSHLSTIKMSGLSYTVPSTYFGETCSQEPKPVAALLTVLGSDNRKDKPLSCMEPNISPVQTTGVSSGLQTPLPTCHQFQVDCLYWRRLCSDPLQGMHERECNKEGAQYMIVLCNLLSSGQFLKQPWKWYRPNAILAVAYLDRKSDWGSNFCSYTKTWSGILYA